MLKVGITGGIGSGKTTACRIFEALDIPVYYADAKAKELMVKNEVLAKNISMILGKNAYTKDHQLNRDFIAEKIFNDDGLLGELNALVHPEVANDFEAWALDQSQFPYCLKEAALIFESNSAGNLDRTVLVIAPEDVRIKRVVKRDSIDQKKVLERIKNQRKQEDNIPLADFIIDNSGERSLIRQILRIHKVLLLENHNRKLLS